MRSQAFCHTRLVVETLIYLLELFYLDPEGICEIIVFAFGVCLCVCVRDCITHQYLTDTFLRHVTSNKTYDFCIFSKLVNVVPIDLKIGTNIDWTYNMYIAKTYINKSNVTYVFHGKRKYPIIKA